MENIGKLTNKLKNNIFKAWKETKKNIGDNIFRGHARSISSDVEDAIAVFTSSVLKNKFEIYIDPSVTVNKKTNRPDFLIIKNNEVVALAEIKSNMGYCRNATDVIDKIYEMNEIFKNAGTIKCKFSNQDLKIVKYSKNTKLLLITLTSQNGGKSESIEKNINYAKNKNINHFLLFDGWYDKLTNRDIDQYVSNLNELLNH